MFSGKRDKQIPIFFCELGNWIRIELLVNIIKRAAVRYKKPPYQLDFLGKR